MRGSVKMASAEEYFDRLIKEQLASSRFVQTIVMPTSKMKALDNNNGKCWNAIIRTIIGVSDWRPRHGTFPNPWRSVSQSEFAAPAFAFTPDSFDDIADSRALELIEEAKRTQRQLLVLWSGGIDSTFVLASFIKNMSPEDRDLIVVCCNFTSILENTNFYINHISNKLECMDYRSFDLTPELLNKYIIIHGDPADCIQGNSLPAYAQFIADGTHKQPWKNHVKALKQSCQMHTSNPHHVEGFGEWFVDRVSENLEEVAPENVTTVADWWWWTYYNFKWEFSCQRPFYFSRHDPTTEFTKEQIADYARNTYFNTADWQMWSYTNLQELVGMDRSTHKILARNYIFELDRDEVYYETKIKMGASPATLAYGGAEDLPFYFDQNWKGHYWIETAVEETALKLLESYNV